MTDTVAAALISAAALIIVALVGVISGQMKDRNAARREQVRVAARHHENLKRLDSLDETISAIRGDLPDGGLEAWIEVVRGHTEALDTLASSMSHLKSRVDEHDQLFAQLRDGATA